jgi:hypothetical protein
MRGCFRNVARLVKEHRKGQTSQNALSVALGYKNGQFISNVERALCTVPTDKLPKLCSILNIPKETMKEAVLKDHEEYLNNLLFSTNSEVVKTSTTVSQAG